MKSIVWGYKDWPITQGFGVYNPDHPDWYAYATEWGQPYGTHPALDIGVPKLTDIHTPIDGVVVASGPNDSYRPNPVAIETADDPATPEDDRKRIWFGHLWNDAVQVGDTVQVGDLIGQSGEQTYLGTMTPDGSGPHLHFEELELGPHIAVDPTQLLTGATGELHGGDVGSSDSSSGDASSGSGGAASGGTSIADTITRTIAAFAPRAGLFVAGVVVFILGIGILFPQVGNVIPIVRAAHIAKGIAHA